MIKEAGNFHKMNGKNGLKRQILPIFRSSLHLRKPESASLANRAKESRSLSLNDPLDDSAAAGQALLVGPVINPMMILVAALNIQRIAIRSVRKR